MKSKSYRNPWLWVPSLYFAEGLPYVLVMSVSVVFYKSIGIDNATIAFYTSLLYLPWMLKPLWSPVVDLIGTKRRWIVMMQFLGSVILILLALAIGGSVSFILSIVLFLILAFLSATHDIAADGFYMLALTGQHQSAFVGVRNMLYRIAMITGQGALIVIAGALQQRFSNSLAWSITFFISALLYATLALYHSFILPIPTTDAPFRSSEQKFFRSFLHTFASFFSRNDIYLVIAFLFFFRFAEALLVKMVPLFLLDTPEKGGLGLSMQQIGLVYGTVGVIALVAGGLLGGYVVSIKGLRWWLWPMTLIMHVPDVVYVYLSSVLPQNIFLIALAIALEQFGYGFGFTAYTLYMIYVSEGEHKTSNYALCTGIMALSMIVPGMISGALQELVGYKSFFLLVLVATIPAFIVTALVKIPESFGRNSS